MISIGTSMNLLFKRELDSTIRLYDGVPSVTSILQVLEDPVWIKKWKDGAKDQSAVNETINNARNRGTYVHLVLSDYYKKSELNVSENDLLKYRKENNLPELDSKIMKFLNGVNKFISQEELIPLAVEEPLINKDLGFAGTPDMIAMFKGKVTMIDWKTSASARLDKETLLRYNMQLAAYTAMWNIKHPNNLIEQLAIIIFTNARVGGLGEIELVDSKSIIKNYFLQFLECKNEFYKLWKLNANYPCEQITLGSLSS